MQCVHGPIFVLRLCVVRVWASSLCSGCGRKCTLSVLRLCAVRVWVPALCSGCGQKVHPHCAQTVCRACMGTRSVLRLWAKSAPALCSDCFFFFFFFFSYRPHATPPLSTRNKFFGIHHRFSIVGAVRTAQQKKPQKSDESIELLLSVRSFTGSVKNIPLPPCNTFFLKAF